MNRRYRSKPSNATTHSAKEQRLDVLQTLVETTAPFIDEGIQGVRHRLLVSMVEDLENQITSTDPLKKHFGIPGQIFNEIIYLAMSLGRLKEDESPLFIAENIATLKHGLAFDPTLADAFSKTIQSIDTLLQTIRQVEPKLGLRLDHITRNGEMINVLGIITNNPKGITCALSQSQRADPKATLYARDISKVFNVKSVAASELKSLGLADVFMCVVFEAESPLELKPAIPYLWLSCKIKNTPK